MFSFGALVHHSLPGETMGFQHLRDLFELPAVFNLANNVLDDFPILVGAVHLHCQADHVKVTVVSPLQAVPISTQSGCT